MKLSEAIMLGSMTGRQIYNCLRDDHDGTCALGAAFKAIGISTRRVPQADTMWPWLNNGCTCPVCGNNEVIVTVVITNHLNDTHRWTREKIAEWVARIEPADIPANGFPNQLHYGACEHLTVQNCEDQTGVLCGKTCAPGSDLCPTHLSEVGQ